MKSIRNLLFSLLGFILMYGYSDGDAFLSLGAFVVVLYFLDDGTRGLK